MERNSILPFPRRGGARGTEDRRDRAPKPCRADRRLGAVGAAAQVARSVGLRGDPSADPVRGLRTRKGSLRFVRRFPPYHEIPERRERRLAGRLAVVTLYSEGWSSKAIGGYLRVHKPTIHRVLKRMAEGLEAREVRSEEPSPSRGVAAGAVRPPRGLGLRRHASGADAIREGVGEQTLRPDFTAPGA